MNYTFRNCTNGDIEFILNLKELCLKWYIKKIYGWDKEVQHKKTVNELSRLSDKMRIIIADNKDIGVTTFYENNGVYVVGLIMIHPDYQNKGIATSIIEEYIKTAKADNKKIIVKTYVKNPARKLYNHLGFVLKSIEGTHAHYEIDFSGKQQVHKEPIIETERLILKPIELSDAEAMYEWNSDPRVAKYMSYPCATDIQQTIDFIKGTLTDEKEWNWAFVLKSENKVIGTGGIGPSSEMEGYWGIGYNFHYEYWHKGYCTEAMTAIVDFAHKELGVNEICSIHAVDNPRSGKVMEKLGMTFHHYGQFSKVDGSETFKAKFYTMEIEE